jgi:hypothetical protein
MRQSEKDDLITLSILAAVALFWLVAFGIAWESCS